MTQHSAVRQRAIELIQQKQAFHRRKSDTLTFARLAYLAASRVAYVLVGFAIGLWAGLS